VKNNQTALSSGPARKDSESLKPVVCFIAAQDAADAGNQMIWARSLRQRLELLFRQDGIDTFITADEILNHQGPLLLVREDAVIDAPLINLLTTRPDFALLDDERKPSMPIAVNAQGKDVIAVAKAMETSARLPKHIAIGAQRPAELDSNFWTKLRKREVPYARIVTKTNHRETEWRMFMGTYKGATDIVTKYLWPKPAFYVTRWLAPTFVTPNIVTTLSAICVLAAFWLFLEGYFFTGLVAAWMMTFLDTVDGKLARTTLTSSKWGDVFDHGIDLIHPPFWYAAWAFGLPAAGFAKWNPEFVAQILLVIIGGYILQRILEGISIAILKLEIHIWRPLDTFFRLVTARRNPNLVLLTLFTVLFGRPDIGLVAVALWTLVCLGLHFIQLAHALFVKFRDGELTSWMSNPISIEKDR
jgi:phosphatidylglycerophosphate synthase